MKPIYATLIFLVFTANHFVVSTKPYKMTLLQMMPFTGAEPRNCQTCRATAQLLADVINNRSDILPDYHIEMQFEDEAGGRLPVKTVFAYYKRFEEEDPAANKTSYQSPVILGPHFSAGCKALGAFIHHLYLVDISTYCGAPFLTNRKLYPNLYLMSSTGRSIAIAVSLFAKQIGQWKQIGIVTDALSANDYTVAQYVQEKAVDNGIQVAWFDIALEVSHDTILSLKASDIRVIVMYANIPLFFEHLLCESYKVGMTGPNYVFIINLPVFADPRTSYPRDEIYPGCTRAMLVQQMRFTLWVGPEWLVENVTHRSEIGHTIAEFDSLLDRHLNGTRPADYEFRYMCYDVVLKGIFALHSAELELRQDHNLTLRNYHQFPEQVMEIVNGSVYRSDLAGLRLERMLYAQNGEVDNDVQVIGSWTPVKGIVFSYTVGKSLNGSDQYSIRNIRPMIWQTRDGNPPRDSKVLRREAGDVPRGAFVAAIVICAILSTYQLASLVGIAIICNRSGVDFVKHFPKSKMAGLFGCLVLNCAAVLFACPSGESSGQAYSTWVARITLLVVALSIIHGLLASKAVMLRVKMRSRLRQTTPSPATALPYTKCESTLSATITVTAATTGAATDASSSSRSSKYEVEISNDSWPKLEYGSLLTTGVFLVINSLYLLLWLLLDPLVCGTKSLSSIYLEEENIETNFFVQICTSENMLALIVSLLAFHVFILLISGYLLYKMNLKNGIERACPEFALIRISLANALTLLVGTSLVVVALCNNLMGQLIAIAFVSLVMSATTSHSWIHPISRFQLP